MNTSKIIETNAHTHTLTTLRDRKSKKKTKRKEQKLRTFHFDILLYINKLKNNNNISGDPQTLFTEKFIFQTRDKVMDQQTTLFSYIGQSIYTLIQPTPTSTAIYFVSWSVD